MEASLEGIPPLYHIPNINALTADVIQSLPGSVSCAIRWKCLMLSFEVACVQLRQTCPKDENNFYLAP